jgi:hypothetical protein
VRALTVRDAATEFYVPLKTVETWVARGHLTLHAGLVDADDVAEVEARLRRRPRLARLLELADDPNVSAGLR